jgi:hypothetical protein
MKEKLEKLEKESNTKTFLAVLIVNIKALV